MRPNPFERFDLDPRLGPSEITRRLRELSEDAPPQERDALREAWEELTIHPWRRLRAAIAAHPGSRPAPGPPPAVARATAAPPTRADVAPRALAGPHRIDRDPLEPPPLDTDPIITEKAR